MIKKNSFSESDIEKFLLTFTSQNRDIAPLGFSLCVQHGGKVNLKKSFGLSRKETRASVSNETLFSASSLAKALTAAAFLIKTREHKDVLSQPLVNYIKDLHFQDGNLTQKVTLMDLLSHRAGLPAHDLLWMLGTPKSSDLLEKIKFMQVLPESYQKIFSYNNIIYAALEILFEKLFNENLMDFISERILKPLQMQNSFFKEEDLQKNQNIASPYFQDRLLKRRNMDSLRSAGGLWTTIEDIAKWMASFDDSFGSAQLLTKSEQDKMFSNQITFQGPLPFISNGLEWMGKDLSYGLGWFSAKPKGLKVYFHPGIIDGYTSLLVFVPELRLRFGVLTNSHLSPFPGILVEKLLSYVYQEDFGYHPEPVANTMNPVKNNEIILNSLHDYIGFYSDPLYGNVEVVLQDQKCFLKYQNKVHELKWHSKTEALFVIEVMALQIPMSINFQFDHDKVVSLLIPFSMDPRINPQKFKKC